MRLLKQILTNNNCYIVGNNLTVNGVMWHSTAANNPYIKRYVQPDDGILGTNHYGNSWNRPTPDGISKCVHAFIGKVADDTIATYQTLPWDMKGWHAGGSANATHIGFEICEDNLTSASYFNAVYKEACELTAYLCEMYNLDPMKDGVVICHSEGYKRGIASNHSDVMHWFSRYGKTMDDARRDVKALMDGSAVTAGTTASGDKVLYRVQCGAFANLANANSLVDRLKSAGYSTYLVTVDGLYKVQCGAFANKDNATALKNKLNASGYEAFITTKSGKSVTSATSTQTSGTDRTIKKGDRVRVKSGAKSYEGISVSSIVYSRVYTVDQLKGNRAVLDVKGICTAFNVNDLIKA